MLRLALLLLNLYAWVIIARALSSWISQDLSNPIIRLLHAATEPVLKPLRQVISPGALGGLDISPILAIVLIQIAKYLLITLSLQ